ncbi:hypothetical protein ABW20_dc0105007 [Dactylellina cionopaga]|nr:hypothetical protein ABW20_dc0105007 [Dactylellina cionopaga]
MTSSLNNTFGLRCSPFKAVLPGGYREFQAICLNTACPISPTPTCDSYNHRGGNGSDPAAATETSGPQASVLVAQLSSYFSGGSEGSMTTSDVTITATVDGMRTLIGTYTVVPIPPGPISFTTSDISVSTNIDGIETFVPTQTVVPIGGGIVVTGTEVITTNGSTITTDYTSTIPSSVIEIASTIISSDGSAITSTYPVTIANTALNSKSSGMETTVTSVFTSGGRAYTTVITTEMPTGTSTRSTRSTNLAPIQTAGPLLMAVVGAGLVGQMF